MNSLKNKFGYTCDIRQYIYFDYLSLLYSKESHQSLLLDIILHNILIPDDIIRDSHDDFIFAKTAFRINPFSRLFN